jgi:hypothetical protein
MHGSLEHRLEPHDWRIRQSKGSSSLILGRCPPLKFASGFGLIAPEVLFVIRDQNAEDRPCLIIRSIEQDGGSVIIVSVTGCPQA